MNSQEMKDLLDQTWNDRRLSRTERHALTAVFDELERDEDRLVVSELAFDRARAHLTNPADRDVLDWLEGVVKALSGATGTARAGCDRIRGPLQPR